jgi:hypothetical protein
MSITVHTGFLSDGVCTGFTNGLSGTSGWCLTGSCISQDLPSNTSLFVPAHDKVPIHTDNRIIASTKVIVAFKKFNQTFEPVGWNIYLIIEGNWSGFVSGRRYSFRGGDMVITSSKLELKTAGRPGKNGHWVTAVQNIRDLGVSKFVIAQALTGITGPPPIGFDIQIVQDDREDDTDDIPNVIPTLGGISLNDDDSDTSESDSIQLDENEIQDELDSDEDLEEDDHQNVTDAN